MLGYYSVFLRDPDVQVELTATERTAMHRYSFPVEADHPHVLLDFLHAYKPGGGRQDVVSQASLAATGDALLTGSRMVNAWAQGRQIYFAAQFSDPWTKLTLYSNGQAVAGTVIEGRALKAAVQFEAIERPVLVKVAISGTSVENALTDLNRELPSSCRRGPSRCL